MSSPRDKHDGKRFKRVFAYVERSLTLQSKDDVLPEIMNCHYLRWQAQVAEGCPSRWWVNLVYLPRRKHDNDFRKAVIDSGWLKISRWAPLQLEFCCRKPSPPAAYQTVPQRSLRSLLSNQPRRWCEVRNVELLDVHRTFEGRCRAYRFGIFCQGRLQLITTERRPSTSATWPAQHCQKIAGDFILLVNDRDDLYTLSSCLVHLLQQYLDLQRACQIGK